MYLSTAILLFLILLALIVGLCRKRAAIKKVCSLPQKDKHKMLDNLIYPLGYQYDSSQDIISSHNNAWQRTLGYTALFDQTAIHFNMVIDCLPIYFDYHGRTWLLELWKGQYGMNTGAEIGLYYTDHIVPPSERASTHFDAVSDSDLLFMSMYLSKKNTKIASQSGKTWWLTVFSMGCFSKPEDLSLQASLTFPNYEMRNRFLDGLADTGIEKKHVRVCGLKVHLLFSMPISKNTRGLNCLFNSISQFMNAFCCKLYCFVTRPFHLTIDRLLYLYYLLPVCFRRTVRLRHCKKKHH